MSDITSKKKINEFIETLKKAESISITYQPPVPDMNEFFDYKKENVLIHCRAYVEFSIR